MTAKMKNTILIVEDEPDIAKLIEKFLNLKDFDTITSYKAKKAMKIIEERYDKIDLILLDILMPGREGHVVLEKVKNNEKFKDIPIVVINQSINRGCVEGYLFTHEKSILPFNQLLNRIRETLGKEEKVTFKDN